MFRRAGSTSSIGKNDWVFLCSDPAEEAVQSIFLVPLISRAAPLRPEKRPDGLSIVSLSFLPRKATVETLMDWAIQQGKLQIGTQDVTELLWIAEELGMYGEFLPALDMQ